MRKSLIVLTIVLLLMIMLPLNVNAVSNGILGKWYGNHIVYDEVSMDLRFVFNDFTIEIYEDGSVDLLRINLGSEKGTVLTGKWKRNKNKIIISFPQTSFTLEGSVYADQISLIVDNMEVFFSREALSPITEPTLIFNNELNSYLGEWCMDKMILDGLPYTPEFFSKIAGQELLISFDVSDLARFKLEMDDQIVTHGYIYETKNGNLIIDDGTNVINVYMTDQDELFTTINLQQVFGLQSNTVDVYLSRIKHYDISTSMSEIHVNDEEYWVCPVCGSFVSGNYCSNCGAQHPSEEKSVDSNIEYVEDLQLDNKNNSDLKRIFDFLFKPITGSSVSRISEISDNSTTALLANGKSYYVLFTSDNGSYSIQCIDFDSSNHDTLKSLYSYTDEDFIFMLNYLLKQDNKQVKSIVPLFGDTYVMSDNKGFTYYVSFICSDASVGVAVMKN